MNRRTELWLSVAFCACVIGTLLAAAIKLRLCAP